MPGDTVIIGGGTYREWVNPKNGGLGNNQRITYINAEGEQPVIRGAEVVGGWTPFEKRMAETIKFLITFLSEKMMPIHVWVQTVMKNTVIPQ